MVKPRVVKHVRIRRGKRSYEITEMKRAPDGRTIYLAKRDDSRHESFGKIFHSKAELKRNYPSIRSELDQRF